MSTEAAPDFPFRFGEISDRVRTLETRIDRLEVSVDKSLDGLDMKLDTIISIQAEQRGAAKWRDRAIQGIFAVMTIGVAIAGVLVATHHFA